MSGDQLAAHMGCTVDKETAVMMLMGLPVGTGPLESMEVWRSYVTEHTFLNEEYPETERLTRAQLLVYAKARHPERHIELVQAALRNDEIELMHDTMTAPAAGHEAAPETKPVPRERANENQILDTLTRLGYDPLNLPPARGKAGAKAEAKSALSKMSDSAFSKAWERLRADKRIMDA